MPSIYTSQTQTEWYTSYIVSINSYACTALPHTVRYVLHLYTDLIHHSKVLIFIDRNKSIQMGFPAIPLKFQDTVWVFMYMYKLQFVRLVSLPTQTSLEFETAWRSRLSYSYSKKLLFYATYKNFMQRINSTSSWLLQVEFSNSTSHGLQ